MSFEFQGDKLISREHEDGQRREFEVQEELYFDGQGGRFSSLHLNQGNPFELSWRSMMIEFEHAADYQAFCVLLRKAHDIVFT